MFGDSFFTMICLSMNTGWSRSCFRPHVWGFFFHHDNIRVNNQFPWQVFVPMFGDSFFTISVNTKVLKNLLVFVPMFGDSFFTRRRTGNIDGLFRRVFVPMFGDSFFTVEHENVLQVVKDGKVFVPMFGDSFFTIKITTEYTT